MLLVLGGYVVVCDYILLYWLFVRDDCVGCGLLLLSYSVCRLGGLG